MAKKASKNTVIISETKLVRDMVAGKTLEEAAEAQSVEDTTQQGVMNMGNDTSMYKVFIGRPFLIHTVTYAVCGILEAVNGSTLLLSKATWIADLGEIHKTFSNVEFPETEFINKNIIVSAQCIIYALELPELPKSKHK